MSSKNGWLVVMVVFVEWNEEQIASMASPSNSKFKVCSVICACKGTCLRAVRFGSIDL